MKAIFLVFIGGALGILFLVFAKAGPKFLFVLAGVVVAMALLGVLGTWIPAQRALSVSPLMLLREE